SVICSTVCAEDDDISQCASSAADGYQVWSELTCRQRADVLLSCCSTTAAGPSSETLSSAAGNHWNGALLCEAAAGCGIPVSVSVCVGSSCPFIVFDTADIDSAVDGLIEAAFRTKTDVHWVLCVQERVVESVLARLSVAWLV
ncbi:unnamed protein product, partial [Tetraodon nigroviridis]